MACDHGMMLMSDHDDAYDDAMLMVNMQANTRSVTLMMGQTSWPKPSCKGIGVYTPTVPTSPSQTM